MVIAWSDDCVLPVVVIFRCKDACCLELGRHWPSRWLAGSTCVVRLRTSQPISLTPRWVFPQRHGGLGVRARSCSNSGQLFPKKQSTAEQSAIFGICCRPAELPRNKLFFERSQASEEPAIDLKGVHREVAGSGPACLKARFRNDG